MAATRICIPNIDASTASIQTLMSVLEAKANTEEQTKIVQQINQAYENSIDRIVQKIVSFPDVQKEKVQSILKEGKEKGEYDVDTNEWVVGSELKVQLDEIMTDSECWMIDISMTEDLTSNNNYMSIPVGSTGDWDNKITKNDAYIKLSDATFNTLLQMLIKRIFHLRHKIQRGNVSPTPSVTGRIPSEGWHSIQRRGGQIIEMYYPGDGDHYNNALASFPGASNYSCSKLWNTMGTFCKDICSIAGMKSEMSPSSSTPTYASSSKTPQPATHPKDDPMNPKNDSKGKSRTKTASHPTPANPTAVKSTAGKSLGFACQVQVDGKTYNFAFPPTMSVENAGAFAAALMRQSSTS